MVSNSAEQHEPFYTDSRNGFPFIAEWLTVEEVEKIVSAIISPIKTIKDIELITTQNNNDE